MSSAERKALIAERKALTDAKKAEAQAKKIEAEKAEAQRKADNQEGYKAFLMSKVEEMIKAKEVADAAEAAESKEIRDKMEARETEHGAAVDTYLAPFLEIVRQKSEEYKLECEAQYQALRPQVDKAEAYLELAKQAYEPHYDTDIRPDFDVDQFFKKKVWDQALNDFKNINQRYMYLSKELQYNPLRYVDDVKSAWCQLDIARQKLLDLDVKREDWAQMCKQHEDLEDKRYEERKAGKSEPPTKDELLFEHKFNNISRLQEQERLCGYDLASALNKLKFMPRTEVWTSSHLFTIEGTDLSNEYGVYPWAKPQF